ncbi:MAG: alpha/beta hydrolase [Marivirga sp.]|nr:alpha/beta hydrolase [Marivirga sp.]
MKRIPLIVIATFVLSSIGVVIFFYKTPLKRPQEPSKPYPYYSEDITFQNIQANISLAGTLTLPSKQGSYPAAILISGSGAQNRDEQISGHKPFLVIADHLTKNGIAVLRFDDRGVGKSTGDFSAATTADFAADVASAVAYLKTRTDINVKKIGLIGHSEGGVVAPMVASSSGDVSFIVLLAAPGIEIKKVLMMQQELIPRAMGASESDVQKSVAISEKAFEMILTSDDRQTLKADLAKLVEENYDDVPAALRPPNMTKEQTVAMQSEVLSSPWYQNLLRYDPAPTLEAVNCPVLALNGEKDIQVTSRENLAGISDALKNGGNTNVTTKELANLNHLFQECETGSLMEYDKIEQTFSPVALKEISDWILKQMK